MISGIIKVEVSVRLRLITLTSTLIIPDITKTSSNNCLQLQYNNPWLNSCFWNRKSEYNISWIEYCASEWFRWNLPLKFKRFSNLVNTVFLITSLQWNEQIKQTWWHASQGNRANVSFCKHRYSAFGIKSFCVAKRFPYKGNTDRYWSLRLSTLLK